ncbi:ArsR/SmtB family transcription factor [Sphingomonas canadensis]|uniref:ArsR/SmtB family transcription factor n=1 Tax=Sphingomonas canadensis TaxID=1219257 RepID=A0ABW3H0K8_9SPHN|nr:metalloregulator ArsR/SmtB family transcription factor [Sphingomonas canadensis]MCW3835122.1 helix-turn-helix domain-containing protein [Sphingomonas canadensis]
MQAADIFKALGSAKRLQILEWLKDPRAHFPPQRDGDLVEDGVCAVFLADKLGVSASTLSEHMRLLVAAGLVTAKPVKQWTFYRRDAEGAARVALMLGEAV